MDKPADDFTSCPTYVCFLVKGQPGVHDYGVLARAYNRDTDSCCICLRLDGTLTPYGFKDINLAIRRLLTRDELCPMKINLPSWSLHNCLIDRNGASPPLAELVAALETKYLTRPPTKKAKKADTAIPPATGLAPKKPRKKARVNNKKRAKRPSANPKPIKHKRTMAAIPIGSDIAAYYYDSEMALHGEKEEIIPCREGVEPGRWYRGHILGER
jgi:hypothetical protein